MAAVRLEPLPPAEQIAAFRRRGAALAPSFAWQDVWQEEHAKAFTVAKSAGFDILADLHGSLTEALESGETFESWRKRIRPVLESKGWWGRKAVVDPQTGRVLEAQLGSTRRLRIIYDTNMRVSHAAGRWAQIARVAERRPWLRYAAVLDERTRQSHRRWHGTVLRWDHPWWDVHFPPNGWRCRCTVQQLSDRDLRRLGYTPTDPPPSDAAPPRAWRNPRTGEIVEVPAGIDPGWGYNPGKAARPATEALGTLAAAPPAIAAVAPRANPFLDPQLRAEFRRWVDDVQAALAAGAARPRGEARGVGLLSPAVLRTLPAEAGEPASAVIMIDDRHLYHLLRDAKRAATTADGLPKALAAEEVARLPEILAEPEAVYWDRETRSLLYVFQPADPRRGKIAVRVNYALKVRDAEGKRHKMTTNAVVSAGHEDPLALDDGGRFRRLDL